MTEIHRALSQRSFGLVENIFVGMAELADAQHLKCCEL